LAFRHDLKGSCSVNIPIGPDQILKDYSLCFFVPIRDVVMTLKCSFYKVYTPAIVAFTPLSTSRKLKRRGLMDSQGMFSIESMGLKKFTVQLLIETTRLLTAAKSSW